MNTILSKLMGTSFKRTKCATTKLFSLLALLLLLGVNGVMGQPWTYNFGTGTGSFTSSTASTSFLPAPTSGSSRVRVGTNPGSIALVNPGISMGTGSELQVTSNTSSTSPTKFSVYDYTALKVGYVKFTIAFNGGTNGVYQFSIGDGAAFSDNSAIGTAIVFSGIQWTFGASNAITYRVLNGSTYGTTGITNSTTTFAQRTDTAYIVEAYFNNETTSKNYVRSGSSYAIASGTWDFWINGTLIGNDLARGGIANNVNIDSWAFNHQVSASAPGTVYLDDFEYSNSLPSTTVPLAPTMGTITQGNQQLSVAFTAGSDGGSAITNYEYSTNGGSSFTACSPSQTTSPILITGLTNGTSYNVQIRAVNAIGSGTATSSTAATPYTTPSAPTINSITPGNNQLSVAFTAGAAGGSAITNYKYSTNGGSSFTACSPSQTTSPIVITGLTNSTTYDIQILAVNAAGEGAATGTTQGTPVALPTITGATTTASFTTTYGTASGVQTFSISGTNLTASIVATAPAGFEVSSDGTTYGSTATFIQSGGNASGSLRIRLVANAAVTGAYNSQSIVLSSTGANDVNISTPASGNAVSTATLTITGLSATDKTYDRTTTVSVSGTAAFSGLMNGESFTPTGSVTWAFADALVGSSKTLTRTGAYATPSTNYLVTQPSLTASITTLTLTTSGTASVTSKTYDRTTAANISGISLVGIINPDVVTITGTYNDKTVNSSKPVTLALSGADNANYTWTAPTGITGDITSASLTVSGAAVTPKLFDGTTTATITGTLSGVISGDAVTLVGSGNFASASVGNGISVTSTSTLSGSDAGNYALTQPTGLTGNISIQAPGLLLLEDNFTATNAALTSNSWTQIGATSTNPISAGSGNGLTYSNYGSSNIGNAAIMTTSGQDIYRTFTSQNPGAGTSTAYFSALVSLSAVQVNGDYFLTLGESSTLSGSATYRARVYAKQGSTASKILFGISTNGTITYTTTEYNTNTTILLAVKHVFTTSTSTSSLFINPSTSSEPTSSDVSDATASNVSTGLDAVVLRQGALGNAPTLVIDGVRAATNWGSLMGNPQYSGSNNIAAGNYNNISVLSGTATATGNVTVNGTTINDGIISIGANTLTLGGSVSGSGTITGGSTANLTIGGSAGTVQFTSGSTNNYLKNLTLNASSSMTIGSNGLNITGGSTFGVVTVASGATLTTGGNLTLKSTATGTAAIGNSTGTITGNITIERFMSQSGRRWRYISAPVSGQTLADWGTKFYITGPGTPGATIGSQNSNGYATSRSNLLGFNNAEGTPASVRIYNRTTTGTIENGWANPASNMATTLTPGVGYRAFIRGPITGNYATDTAVIGYFEPGAAPTQSSFTLTQTGGITNGVNAGSVSMPINSTGTDAAGAFNASTDGWNLLGNPYPCAFDWLAFWSANTNRTNIANVIYIFDATANSYKSYNTSSGGSLTSGIIPSGSAFFVQATGTGASLTFTEAFKTSSAPIALHKKGTTSDELQIKYYRDSTESDQYILKMINGATLQKDDYDIIKLKNDNLNLSSYGADSINLTLSSIPVVIEETKISLNVEATQRGTYKFDFNSINDFDNGISVSLLDKFTQKTIDIRKNPIYSFVMDSLPHQWGKDRFVLILNANSTTTSIENENSIINTKMAVYPNPASDVLNISISNANFKNSSISIYNVSGSELLNSTMNGASTQLNIEALSSGVYFVKVKNENGFDRTVKFIK